MEGGPALWNVLSSRVSSGLGFQGGWHQARRNVQECFTNGPRSHDLSLWSNATEGWQISITNLNPENAYASTLYRGSTMETLWVRIFGEHPTAVYCRRNICHSLYARRCDGKVLLCQSMPCKLTDVRSPPTGPCWSLNSGWRLGFEVGT